MSFLPAVSVWNRTEYFKETLGQRAFVAVFSLWIAIGIALSALGAVVSYAWQPSSPMLIGFFVVSLAGVFIALKGDRVVWSVIGYLMIVIPFGLITGPIVALYTPASAFKVLTVTLGTVVGLGIIGASYPRSLEHWGIWLVGALLIFLFGSLVTILAGSVGVQIHGAMQMWDWTAVVLFSGFIIYDMNRAMSVPRSHKNAVDIAIAVYLDFANLFLHLLNIMGTPAKRD
jgi:FtsH-binding integral membrane protein